MRSVSFAERTGNICRKRDDRAAFDLPVPAGVVLPVTLFSLCSFWLDIDFQFPIAE